MVSESVIKKACKFVRHGDVILCSDSVPPFFLHLKVNEHDVYRKLRNQVINWSCNAKGDDWGCMLNIKADRSKPFCSHTLSSEIYLKKIWRSEYAQKEEYALTPSTLPVL